MKSDQNFRVNFDVISFRISNQLNVITVIKIINIVAESVNVNAVKNNEVHLIL